MILRLNLMMPRDYLDVYPTSQVRVPGGTIDRPESCALVATRLAEGGAMFATCTTAAPASTARAGIRISGRASGGTAGRGDQVDPACAPDRRAALNRAAATDTDAERAQVKPSSSPNSGVGRSWGTRIGRTSTSRRARSPRSSGSGNPRRGRPTCVLWNLRSPAWPVRDRSPAVTTAEIIELAIQAEFLYNSQVPTEQRRLLETVLSNCTFNRGSVCPTYTFPVRSIRQRG